MNSIQFLTFPEIQTIISKISDLYYKELGFSYKIINDNPGDELIPENFNPKILIFLPKEEIVPSPSIVYGTSIYNLATTLRVENDVFVSNFLYKKFIFDVRDQTIKFEKGNTPFGKHIALVYRFYQKNDTCVLNIPSFVLRHEKTKIYRYENDTKVETITCYNMNTDKNEQIKHSWNIRLSCQEKDTDLLLMDTYDDVYYFEYDPGRILLSTNPIPSICGKSVLVMKSYQQIKRIVWINNTLVSNKDSDFVTFSHFNSDLKDQTVVYTNYFVPAIVTKEMYTPPQLIVELINDKNKIENFVVTNMLNGKIVKKYSIDESIDFNLPVVLFQTILINQNNIIPFLFNEKLISDKCYIANRKNIKNVTESERFVQIQKDDFSFYFLNLKEPTLVSYCLSGSPPTVIASLAKYFLLYVFDLKVISSGKTITIDPDGLINIDQLQNVSQIEIIHKSKQIKIYEISLKVNSHKTSREPEITSYFDGSYKKIPLQSKDKENFYYLLDKSSKVTKIVIPDEINLVFFDCSLITSTSLLI
ncbi:hypothetical protein TVAG_363960 [Trichomonas vaginalis G3]|uniref:Uncharacterized protein n=1 Tax=Trichomonas vaginalis (strain ATCC PRA-98 / G3) TaxID=412133 RepID=A2EDW5_TRIV3|nr:hypothetical protein TVAGG3_0948330 [Trichomonas vaginalis G3]EAY09181.1 hypothetical protein TVAG_363960 [Trichomonas vaginalis G3]KAI5487032.1 hypothetical protein TVAGG3_0948330 [Trichomonas vaginalis G3]|eukprot:XP_001321404.1 hypothetical protein [Trichomonas vaginalis G3]